MLTKYKKKLEEEGEFYLLCKVFPASSCLGIKNFLSQDIEGQEVDVLSVNLKASPSKNKANQELIRFLAKEFAVSKDGVSIVNGQSSRNKLVKIKK